MINEEKIKQVVDQFASVKVDMSDTPYKITPDDYNKVKAMVEVFNDLEIYEALKDARKLLRTVARFAAPKEWTVEAKTYLQTYYGEQGITELKS